MTHVERDLPLGAGFVARAFLVRLLAFGALVAFELFCGHSLVSFSFCFLSSSLDEYCRFYETRQFVPGPGSFGNSAAVSCSFGKNPPTIVGFPFHQNYSDIASTVDLEWFPAPFRARPDGTEFVGKNDHLGPE